MSITSTITNISINTHKQNPSSSSSAHRISNGAQACAACKYQRRKCAPDCILAPYFPHDKQSQFLNAHKLFGVSNITKIIRDLKQRDKDIAMETIIFQSDMRNRDPVGGCYAIVKTLHYQIAYVRNELEFVLQQIAACRAQQQAEFNDNNQSYQVMPIQYDQEYVNQQLQQPQQQQQHEEDVCGSEVLNNNPPQDFQYSWGLNDGSPLEVGNDLCKEIKTLSDVNLGNEYVEISSFERGESFKFDQQAIDKSEMILKAQNLGLEEEVEGFEQHQIPENDLRSAATLFTLTS